MLEKFYFEGFVISFSIFMGAIASLILESIWQNKLILLLKIVYSLGTFLGLFFFTILVLFLVIRFIGARWLAKHPQKTLFF